MSNIVKNVLFKSISRWIFAIKTHLKTHLWFRHRSRILHWKWMGADALPDSFSGFLKHSNYISGTGSNKPVLHYSTLTPVVLKSGSRCMFLRCFRHKVILKVEFSSSLCATPSFIWPPPHPVFKLWSPLLLLEVSFAPMWPLQQLFQCSVFTNVRAFRPPICLAAVYQLIACSQILEPLEMSLCLHGRPFCPLVSQGYSIFTSIHTFSRT